MDVSIVSWPRRPCLASRRALSLWTDVLLASLFSVGSGTFLSVSFGVLHLMSYPVSHVVNLCFVNSTV